MISSCTKYLNTYYMSTLFSVSMLTLSSMVSFPIQKSALAAEKINTPSSGLTSVKTPTLISLEFSRVAISEALNMVSKQGGLNLIVGEDVQGFLPRIYLEDVSPEDAIRYIAQAGKLTWKKLNAKTYLITKAAIGSESTKEVNEAAGTSGDIFDPDEDFKINVLPRPSSSSQSVSNLSTVQLKNIKPSTMAYWLDPQHQKPPVEAITENEATRDASKSGTVRHIPRSENVSSANPSQFVPYSSVSNQTTGSSGNGQGGAAYNVLPSSGGTVALPTGVDNLIAVDALNVLLVRGTDEGVDRLREVIALLDRPIAQIEIEAQFVSVDVRDVDTLGLDFSDTSLIPNSVNGSDGVLAISRRIGNFRARLQATLSNGRNKLVTSPRVTTFNNHPATLSSTTDETFFIRRVTIVPGNNGGNNVTQVDFDRFEVTTGTSLTVVPTLLRDGTINITLRPNFSSPTPGFQASPDAPVVPTILQQVITTSANIKDGDTLAIGGLRSSGINSATTRVPFLSKIPIIGGLFKGKENSVTEKELIIFLTARVVRRIDDPVAGT